MAQVGPAFETQAECRFLSMVREKFVILYFADLFNRFEGSGVNVFIFQLALRR